MRFFLCLLSLSIVNPIFYPLFLDAKYGKVMLRNGNDIKGDIEKLSDGGCWVTYKKSSIKIEKSEIKKIIAYSGKNQYNKFSNTVYDDVIHSAAHNNQLDPALVKAVIKAESNFNPNDKSHKGACGLMQIMPRTARLLGVKSIYSPEENINAGARYLRDMLFTFDGDLKKALAAYNAGPSVVARYKNVPPYKETRDYINKVYQYYDRYQNEGNVCSYVDESGCLNIYNVR